MNPDALKNIVTWILRSLIAVAVFFLIRIYNKIEALDLAVQQLRVSQARIESTLEDSLHRQNRTEARVDALYDVLTKP